MLSQLSKLKELPDKTVFPDKTMKNFVKDEGTLNKSLTNTVTKSDKVKKPAVTPAPAKKAVIKPEPVKKEKSTHKIKTTLAPAVALLKKNLAKCDKVAADGIALCQGQVKNIHKEFGDGGRKVDRARDDCIDKIKIARAKCHKDYGGATNLTFGFATLAMATFTLF